MSLPQSPTVKRVLEGQLCSGCGLCAGVSQGAIEMGDAPPGYNRPVQKGPIGEAAEAAIAKACPGAVVAPWPETAHLHPSWGPYLSIDTGFSTDERVRFQGSSGGGVTGLALFALKSGLVDRVVHVIADPAHPTGNRITVSTNEDDLIAGAGSRYVSSSPLHDIDRMLAQGGAMAFIGKPCDVSALRQLGTLDPRVAAHVPLMLSFFCAGIPSRGAVGRVLEAMDAPPGEVTGFRYRGNGWPGQARATLSDGGVREMSYEASWGGYLSKEVQFRCKICPDAVGGVADIACADAWYGGETGYPTFEELPGRSLIVARTSAGQALLAQAVSAGAISTEPLAVGEIDLMQPSQAARKRLILARTAAIAVLGRPRPVMSGLQVRKSAAAAKPAEQLRNFLGTIRRALQGRLSQR